MDRQTHNTTTHRRPTLTFDEWIETGIRQGYCGPPVCNRHDGTPMTYQEAEDDDICVLVIRLYENHEQKASIERDHAPSQWRNLWKTGE